MLEGQHGRGHEHGDLFAVGHGAERRADGDFGFAVTHVTADETVDDPSGLDVRKHVVDRLELVIGLVKRKARLEFAEKRVAGRETHARAHLTLGVKLDEVDGELFDRVADLFFGFVEVLGARAYRARRFRPSPRTSG